MIRKRRERERGREIESIKNEFKIKLRKIPREDKERISEQTANKQRINVQGGVLSI